MNTAVKLMDWKLLDDLFEERAAIIEYDAGYSRWQAEQAAAQGFGFANKAELKSHIQSLKAKRFS
jgi:hypothetical protein